MAIRIRKGRKSPYQVYWRNPHTGKQESASCATLLDARKLDAEIRYRLEFQPDSFAKKETAPAEGAAAKNKEFCLEDVFITYLKEKQFTEHRVGVYLSAMRTPLNLFGRKRMDAITEQDLGQIVTAMLAAPVRKSTSVYYARMLFSVFRWAKKRHIIAEMPELPELPSAPSQHFIPPTPEELARIYAVADPHVRRMIILGAKLGVRVGPCEAFRIKWSDFDFARAVCRVPAALKNQNEPWREVPIQADILPVLKQWCAEDKAAGIEYVVHWQRHAVRNIRAGWVKALKLAGITRPIRPYDLRHAFATDLIAGGADPGTVAKLMGHTSVAMIFRHYQHVLTQQKKAAIEALPKLGLYDQTLYDQKGNALLQ